MKTENELSQIILDTAFELHNQIGPGLLESVYQEGMYHKLLEKGIYVEKEKGISVYIDNKKIDKGFRLDLLVENKVVVEIKSIETIAPIHQAQVITYLKLGGYKLGLLLNFNTKFFKNGIRRLVNGL